MFAAIWVLWNNPENPEHEPNSVFRNDYLKKKGVQKAKWALLS